MKARLGRLESVTSVGNTGGATSARRYASFHVRGWRPGATGTLEIAHDQSGERMRVESLGEAIDWIQSRSISATAPIEAM